MLAVTPNGVPSFVSSCYGGRISDKQITKLSGLLSPGKFDKGDSIMADRGFDIDDFLSGTHVKLNIPAFLITENSWKKTKLWRQDGLRLCGCMWKGL